MPSNRIAPLVLLLVVAFAASYLVFSLRFDQQDRATVDSRTAEPVPSENPPGMVWIRGGEFLMGSELPDARDDEQPVHPVRVSGFWIDQTEVTNDQFAKFVDATGYVTTAERTPVLEEIMKQVPPGTPPPTKEQLVPGSLVFHPTDRPVPTEDFSQWWSWTPGTDWRHPEGPGSSIADRGNHPAVQVSWDDAVAYCDWAGMRLPTEAEWEFAARGGLDGKHFIWGDEDLSQTHPQVNVWQGVFPYKNLLADGFDRTAPVKSFPPNGYDLYDMGGNVWEWCSDWYAPNTYARRAFSGVAQDPAGPPYSLDPGNPRMPVHVERGGSFLCNPSYCASYRPSARMFNSPDTGMAHLGFRCVKSGPRLPGTSTAGK